MFTSNCGSDESFILSFDDTHVRPSGLTLKNTSTSPITIKSFYLQSLDVGSSTPCYGSVISGANMFGALWTSTEVPVNGVIGVDKNFLYNSMLNFLYQATLSISIPYETPGATSSWCVKVGLSTASPVSQTSAASSSLVDSSVSADIVISCDDATATCTATPSIEQVFPI